MKTLNDFIEHIRKTISILDCYVSIHFHNYEDTGKKIRKIQEKWALDLNVWKLSQFYYRDIRDWDAFYRVYDEVEKIHPNKLQIKRNLATALFGSFRYKDAKREFEYCVNNWESLETTFSALLNTKARLLISYEFLGEKEFVFSMLQEIKGESKWDLDIILCEILYCLETDAANLEKFLDEKIKNAPYFYALYFWKGLYCQYYLHKPEEAYKCYLDALAHLNSRDLRKNLDPYFMTHRMYAEPSDILMCLVEACIDTGRFREALSSFYLNKLRVPDIEIDFRVGKIFILMKMNKLKKAESSARSLLRGAINKNTQEDCWILLSKIQISQNRIDDGINSINEALKLDVSSYEALSVLGEIYLRKKDWLDGRGIFLRLIEINRFDFKNWKMLGLCHYGLGDMLSARTAFEYSTRLNPNDAESWISLGDVYKKDKLNDLARNSYLNGLKRNWLDNETRKRVSRLIDEL